MLFVGTSIIHPSTEGVFLLCNILDLLIYSYYQMFANINFWLMEKMFFGKSRCFKQSWTEFRKLTDDEDLRKIWKEIHSKGKHYRALEMLFAGNRLENILLFFRLRYFKK